MLVTLLIACVLIFVNLQNCSKIENQSFLDIDNSTNIFASEQENNESLADINLKLASEKLNILYFKKYQKKRCSYMCHYVHKENETSPRSYSIDKFVHLLYSAPVKPRKRLCTLLWKCQK